MSDGLRDTLGQLLDRLVALASQDQEIRGSLNKLAREIVQLTDAPAQQRRITDAPLQHRLDREDSETIRSRTDDALPETTAIPSAPVEDPASGKSFSPPLAAGQLGEPDIVETPISPIGIPERALAATESLDSIARSGALPSVPIGSNQPTDTSLALPVRSSELPGDIAKDLPPARAASVIREPISDLESVPAARFRLRESRPELSIIEARCRLKAEGALWAATRQRLIAEGADWETIISPKDRDIISRAKELPDCFLWMNHPSGPAPSDLGMFECVAGFFEVVADGVVMLERLLSRDELPAYPKALDLLAEAQSSLRVAVSRLGPINDTDQRAVYEWLRFLTSEHQIFVQRYMRIDDNPDPFDWSDLSARIESFHSSIEEQHARKRRHDKLLGKVRHKTSILAQGVDDADAQWRILGETVDELINSGLPPSNLQLREHLIPILDLMPEAFVVPRGLQLALREIDQFLASASPVHEPAETITAPEILQVRALLSGRSLLLIGGLRRPLAARAIEEAFGLRELIWNESREHVSIESFAPYVARSDVAAVILAIRWSSHSFGEVRMFCDQHDKPLVRLPGGYNPRQLAAQILVQCSDRLGGVGAR